MALVLADRVRETTTVTGTGTATLLGAAPGYQSFSAVGNANTTYYVIANQSATEWEVGIGTYTASGTLLSRDTVLSSSNSGSLVNFSAGTKDVFVDYPAGRAVYEDAAGNVDGYPITGGTINNTTVGATTPSTGVFTTLTATGNINLTQTTTTLNTSSGTIMSFVDGGLSPNTGAYIQFGNSATSASTQRAAGANTNISIYWLTKGTGFHSFNTNNATGTQQLVVAHTASAVNYVQVTGGATGVTPAISFQGSDGNIGGSFVAKGSNGTFRFLTNTTLEQLRILNTASSVNYATITGSATGFGVVFSAAGTDTNIPAVVQPKGTGALQAQQTDSTATGGNARGANAVDWQTGRGFAVGVASGAYSVLGGGYGSIASGIVSGVFAGNQCQATNFNTVVLGGAGNVASGVNSSVVGGNTNSSTGYYGFVGNGFTNSTTSNSAVTTQSGTMNGTTAVTLSGSNASIKVGQYITGTSIANDTHVAAISGTSLTLSKVASGSSTSTLSFFTPHGVVVGGGNNQATGSYSFIGGGGDAGTASNRNVASGDWSFVGGGYGNTASGLGSFIGSGITNSATNNRSVVAGGFGNQSTGQDASVLGGTINTASAIRSAILGGSLNVANSEYSSVLNGQYVTTRSIAGAVAFGAGFSPIASVSGTSQCRLFTLGRQTTDATATILATDGNAVGSFNQVILPNNSAYYFRGEVVSGVTGGGNTKGFFIEGVIKRGANAASTALVGTPTVTSNYADAGASAWTIAVTADTTNGGLAVTFTGQASTTIRTVAQIRTTEMTY